jgi:anion-transporting  ArsA/GET3 family ATPase
MDDEYWDQMEKMTIELARLQGEENALSRIRAREIDDRAKKYAEELDALKRKHAKELEELERATKAPKRYNFIRDKQGRTISIEVK